MSRAKSHPHFNLFILEGLIDPWSKFNLVSLNNQHTSPIESYDVQLITLQFLRKGKQTD